MLRDLAIATRSNSQQPDECASHHIDAAESSSRGHLLNGFISAFELTTRRFDAHLKYVLRRGGANFSGKYTLKIPHAH